MTGVRSIARALLATAAFAVASCGPIDDAGYAPDIERELDRGRAHAAALVAATADTAASEQAIALGYLERLRLGMGSPFRLMEYSLQDPRLDREDREVLAWALLARALDGDGYRVDPRALAQNGDVESVLRHLELIEGAIRGAADPDGGVLAVRLAYAMAAAEGVVTEPFRDRMSRAAALVRDRVQSRADAARLLKATRGEVDPMALLTVWRVERRFAVERPARLAPPSAIERDAIGLAPRLLESIRSIDARPRVGPLITTDAPLHRPLLSASAAASLAAAAEAHDAPPQTPVTVAVRTYARADREMSPALRRFFREAQNEEKIVAQYAVLWHEDLVRQAPRLGVLMAAVGLRAYAQERPWFPGFEGPTRRDLEDRFGLASVEFPADVPPHWRPYYRRMLETSLSDLQRVLPSLDVRGLNIRFEARRESPGTLAVHDPKTRTIFIPPSTGAGTLAHEIAHDLDWQTALRRYRVRGDYATDRAVRLSDERLARVLRGLTASSLPQPVSLDHSSHATRPAEVFARSIDWFATVALAREGRMNGYLSSVQDDVLTGYGTVTPPDVTGTAGQALIALLDEVAPVYPETRRWFLGSYGRMRAATAYDLARRVVEAPLIDDLPSSDILDRETTRGEPPVHEPTEDLPALDEAPDSTPVPGPDLSTIARAMERLARLEEAHDEVVGLVEGSCQAVGYDYSATDARRRLVQMVTEARARGIALAAVGAVAGPEGRAWAQARLEGRSVNPEPDPVVTDVLTPLVDRARDVGSRRTAGEPLALAVQTSECGPLPFLLD